MIETLVQKKLEVLTDLVSPTIVSRLGELVTSGPPPALLRISPPRLAEAWGVERRELLAAFLAATRAGVFDMEWNIRCPSCTGSTQLESALAALRKSSHCAFCRIDISAGFDDAVEVTFKVNPALRELGSLTCLDVMRYQSVFEQPVSFVVEPGATAELALELTEGTWRFYSPDQTIGAPVLVRAGEASGRPLELRFDGAALSRLDTDPRGPGSTTIRVRSEADQPLALGFARTRDFPWLSGAEVACVQTFRDLFSAELIDRDESFSIRSAAFVFTDIKGSTAMYERLGDSGAYTLVREHFRILQRVVDRHRGAVVKTIGDAIMAVFTSPGDSLRAVLDMQEAFLEFNRHERTREDVTIKVGAHHGPCIAVTSNDRIDYFGRTVNIAARIQGLSLGDDIMLSSELLDQPGLAPLLGEAAWRATPFTAPLKGVSEAYPVVKLERLRAP